MNTNKIVTIGQFTNGVEASNEEEEVKAEKPAPKLEDAEWEGEETGGKLEEAASKTSSVAQNDPGDAEGDEEPLPPAPSAPRGSSPGSGEGEEEKAVGKVDVSENLPPPPVGKGAAAAEDKEAEESESEDVVTPKATASEKKEVEGGGVKGATALHDSEDTSEDGGRAPPSLETATSESESKSWEGKVKEAAQADAAGPESHSEDSAPSVMSGGGGCGRQGGEGESV